MNIKRLIQPKFSKYVISAIIGIGLATLFRKASIVVIVWFLKHLQSIKLEIKFLNTIISVIPLKNKSDRVMQIKKLLKLRN